MLLVTNNKQLNNYSTILLLSRRNTTLIPLSFFFPILWQFTNKHLALDLFLDLTLFPIYFPNSLDTNTPIPCPLTNKPTNQPTLFSFPILWTLQTNIWTATFSLTLFFLLFNLPFLWTLQTLKSILSLHTNIILFNSKLFNYPSTKLSTCSLITFPSI